MSDAYYMTLVPSHKRDECKAAIRFLGESWRKGVHAESAGNFAKDVFGIYVFLRWFYE